MRAVFFFKTPSVDPRDIAAANRRGLARLSAMQMPDGSFPLLQHEGRAPPRSCHGLFSTLCVLLAVGDLLPSDSRTTAIGFLLSNRRRDGLWTFDPETEIPPDSDDTACALAALARYAPPTAEAASADLLRSFWRADGGPFATWRDAPAQWLQRNRDDAVVNCNILFALRELGESPSAAEIRSVIALINQSTKGTRYYCSPTAIAYAARRAGIPMDALHPGLLARPRFDSGVLPAAQWLSAVRGWDNGAVAHVLTAQSSAGDWAAEDWFRGAGPSRWGSAALSTALCVEGLRTAACAAPDAAPRRHRLLRLFSTRSTPT